MLFPLAYSEAPACRERKVENGLAELLDLVGASGEAREMADEELGMGTQFFRIATVCSGDDGQRP